MSSGWVTKGHASHQLLKCAREKPLKTVQMHFCWRFWHKLTHKLRPFFFQVPPKGKYWHYLKSYSYAICKVISSSFFGGVEDCVFCLVIRCCSALRREPQRAVAHFVFFRLRCLTPHNQPFFSSWLHIIILLIECYITLLSEMCFLMHLPTFFPMHFWSI